MHFCTECRNMYYLKLRADAGSLIYYCRHCGHEDPNLTADDVCVSRTQLKRGEQKYAHIVNEYTKLDPTLPRTETIRCPSQTCPSNSSDTTSRPRREVIYLRYDDANMKYIYLCAHCDTMWKTDEQR